MTLVLKKVTKEEIANAVSEFMRERVMEVLKDLPDDAVITAKDVLNFRNLSPSDKWILAADSMFVGEEASYNLFCMLEDKWIENCRQRDAIAIKRKQERRKNAEDIRKFNAKADNLCRNDMKVMINLLSQLTEDYKKEMSSMQEKAKDEVKYETLREFILSDSLS